MYGAIVNLLEGGEASREPSVSEGKYKSLEGEARKKMAIFIKVSTKGLHDELAGLWKQSLSKHEETEKTRKQLLKFEEATDWLTRNI